MTEAFFPGPPGTQVSDLVTCKECGTRYDSDHNAFCPRCGSTARGAVLTAAVAVAQRRDPGRRRVQASGALLLIVGGLFLASAVASAIVTRGDLPPGYADLMANQDGGTLVLTAPNGTTYDATVSAMGGSVLANVTSASADTEVDLDGHAAVRVRATFGNVTRNATAIVLAGDVLRLDVGTLAEGYVAVGSNVATINRVATGLAIAFTLVLVAGGLAALLLRAWPLAVVAAVLGALLGMLSLFFFLLTGLLFAIPFGFAAYFILRGRRHFLRE